MRGKRLELKVADPRYPPVVASRDSKSRWGSQGAAEPIAEHESLAEWPGQGWPEVIA